MNDIIDCAALLESILALESFESMKETNLHSPVIAVRNAEVKPFASLHLRA